MEDPAIRIDHLTKRFGDNVAVRDLSLEVQPGEIYTYLGPNGAGKTTTIKVLAGLLRPTSGSAAICGYDIQAEPVAAKRLVGFVPDHPYLYEKLTARDFVRFVADLFGMRRSDAEARMEEYFALFGLTDAVDEFVENYSHGMRQKLVFSVSLLHDPRVLIVDEPMVGLDPQSARTLKNLLRRKARDEKMTIFLSTHTLSVAEELADRIGVLHHGELIFNGTLEQLRAQVSREGNLENLFLMLTGGMEDEAGEEPGRPAPSHA